MLARLILILLCLISTVPPTRAEDDAPMDHDLQGWGAVSLNGSLDAEGRFPASVEIHPRLSNHMQDLSQVILFSQLGVRLRRNVTVSQGYAWGYSHSPPRRSEQRLYQQVRIDLPFKRFSITSRTRLEQRFLSDLNEAVIRGREQIRLSIPLGRSSPWSLVLTEEPHVNFNRVPGGPRPGFEQNRAFIGLSRRVNAHLSLEGGYMGQFVNRRSPAADQWNHILLLSVNARIR